MRGMTWVVSDQAVDYTMIGRPVLESMGINARHLIEAFSDQNGGIENVTLLISGMDQSNAENHNKGKLASLLRDGVYHIQGGFEYDHLDDTIPYIDFGENKTEEINSALIKSISEAESSGMSAEGMAELSDMLNTSCD